jgi:hypothetical protein
MSLFIISIIIVFAVFTIVAIVDDKCYHSGTPITLRHPAPKKFRLDTKVKLNVQSIIRWEQLRKKSFSLMDYSDKDDVELLLYTTTICNKEDKIYTFEVFRHTLSNEKIARGMIVALERDSSSHSISEKTRRG